MTGAVWHPSVTVVIPTLNGAELLGEVLAAVSTQREVTLREILVIDSSSTDDTERIARSFPLVRFERIRREEFGHGKTRQWAAEIARGELLAYLTQDATPATDRWLAALIEPLRDELVAGVVGRQIPRRGCVPLIKYDLERVFANPGPTFYSDTNAATRRVTLLGPVPYRDVDFSEDYCFAVDAIAAGYRIAYAADGSVWHSNDVPLRLYSRRIRAEVAGHAVSGQPLPRYGIVGAFLRGLLGALREAPIILRDRDYSVGQRLRWTFLNPCFHLARWHAIYWATRGRAS